MAPSASSELPAGLRRGLLSIARDSIKHGLDRQQGRLENVNELPSALPLQCGVFVTLTIEGRLRGCIGSIQAAGPLAQSVSDAAFAAAFRDPRFPSLERDELSRTRIEVSLLSPCEPLMATDRAHLLRQLVPGEDGLLLQDGSLQATFLPKVWEQLPTPAQFLEQLLFKAGLPADHWSDTLSFERYYSTSFYDSV